MLTISMLYFIRHIWTAGRLVPQVNFFIISIILDLTLMASFA